MQLSFRGTRQQTHTKVAFITAIYGGYESTCKRYVEQSVPTDFICFTNNRNIQSNKWVIDTNPYHITHRSKIDSGEYINSIDNNKHTFNISKYYKQSFYNIPILKQYDVIIWIDGTIAITNPNCAKWLLDNIQQHKIIGWSHCQNGILKNEVDASNFGKYSSKFWFGQPQPCQDVIKQYEAYIQDGYDEAFFKSLNHRNPEFGVWLTCFVAFDMKNEAVKQFLDLWYLQTLKYTTQDQVGFPYVVQKTGLIPYTLPDENIRGMYTSVLTDFYIKCHHGY
jgi:hypothetical protein